MPTRAMLQEEVAGELAEADLLSLFDGALDAIVIADSDSVVLGWNRSAEQMFGYSRDEAMGRDMSEMIIPHALREAHSAGVRRYLATGEGVVINNRIEIVALHRDGREFPVELTILPLRSAGGTRFCGFVRDISRRKEAERKLSRRMLEAQVLYEVTGHVAHGGTTDDSLRICLQKVCELAGWSAGHLYRPGEDDDDRLFPSRIWHVADDRLGALVEASECFVFRRGEGLPGRVWEAAEPRWIIDIAADPALPRHALFRRIGISSAFAFPVFVDGRLAVVLEFFSLSVREPEPELILTVRNLSEQLGRVLERRQALEQQKILMRELNHRIGNMLAITGAIFRRTVAGTETKDELARQFEARLAAIASAQRLLGESDWSSASLERLVSDTFAPYGDGSAAPYRMSGPPLSLSAQETMTLSLVLHELCTNAAKHGALSSPDGRVSVDWTVAEAEPPTLTLRWREEGGPPVGEGGRTGFGSELIKLMLARLKGSASSVELADTGLVAEFVVPLQRRHSGPGAPDAAAPRRS
ncbi:MAG TPA: PAS domain S-box protein [Thermohalobaculum sp.]|nr:PAS domain S-box protein [Thermohalobaculum sp.]